MNVSAIICISLLIIIGISFYDGYQKGLLSIIKPIVAFLIAYMFSHSGDIELIPDFGITDRFSSTMQQAEANILENLQNDGLEILLPEDSQAKEYTNMMGEGIAAITEMGADKMLSSSKTIVIFVITYSITSLIFNLIIRPVKQITLISTGNRIAGALINTALCIIKVWILMDIIYILALVIPQVNEIQCMLQTSNFYNYLCKINPTMF